MVFLHLNGFVCCNTHKFIDVFPHIFIVALAGIALLGTISHNIAIAFAQIEEREAALFTFYVGASGIQFFGIGSAFWGLVVGIIVFLLKFKAQKLIKKRS